MARFTGLSYQTNYDVISPVDGQYMTQGIQGGELMLTTDWPDGAEAHESGEMNYDPSDPDCEDETAPAAIAE